MCGTCGLFGSHQPEVPWSAMRHEQPDRSQCTMRRWWAEQLFTRRCGQFLFHVFFYDAPVEQRSSRRYLRMCKRMLPLLCLRGEKVKTSTECFYFMRGHEANVEEHDASITSRTGARKHYLNKCHEVGDLLRSWRKTGRKVYRSARSLRRDA